MNYVFRFTLIIYMILSYIPISAQDNFVISSEENKVSYSYDLDDECYTYDDPFEKTNRPLLYFNGALDYIILHPVASSYKKVVPSQLRTIVGNFVDNLTIPFSIVNNMLQLNFVDASKNFCVFTINSVWGVGGLFDVTSIKGLKHNKQTFGDTLAQYGVAPGPYLMVPFFGPTNTRDLMDILFKGHVDPMPYGILPKYVAKLRPYVKMVHDRSLAIGKGEEIISKSADPYSAVKSVTYQKRESVIRYNGKRSKCNPSFY